jgi:hypothetical protein
MFNFIIQSDILSTSGDALITWLPISQKSTKMINLQIEGCKTTHELHPLINLGCKITQLHPVRTGTNIRYINEEEKKILVVYEYYRHERPILPHAEL